jgi:hypothetical protein
LALLALSACGGGGDDGAGQGSSSTAPTIIRVNPSTVIGSTREQELTILGTNLSDRATIVLSWRGVVDYSLPAPQVSFDGSTSVRIRVTTMEDADEWSVRIVNPDGQSAQGGFRVVDPRLVPLVVSVPVQGAFRETGSENRDCNNAIGLWTLCQHGDGFHRPSGGISGSDDTFAWDANQPDDLDRGKQVFAVAAGRVVRYAGAVLPGASSGAVLIEHRTGDLTWWSGYLHMSNVQVVEGQEVTSLTPLGRISDVCECGSVPNHLHFAIYYGHNSAGNLKSRRAEFQQRDATQSGQIIVGDSSGRLIVVDPVARLSRTIGTMGVVMTDIALSPDGRLFGVTHNDLYSIDPSTAQVTFIGSHFAGLVALTFRTDGTLFAAGGNRLVTVDTSSAQLTTIGWMARYALGDLEFGMSGGLYMTTSSGELVELDPTTAATTVVGTIGFPRLYSLSVASPDTFYSFSGSQLLRVDAGVGAATVLYDVGPMEVWGSTTIP